MANNDGLAAARSSDNSTAEGLADEDFIFEGEDGQLVGAGSDFDDGITTEEAATGTETQEGLAAPADGTPVGEVPAGQQPAAKPAAAAAPAGAPTTTPTPQTTPQAPASGSEQVQRAPLFHELVRDNFDAAVEHVVRQGNFALSQKDAEIIDPAAAPVIQRVAAQVYLKSVATFSQMLHETMPTIVRNLQGVSSEEQKSQENFMTSYGFKQEHLQEVTQVANYVRATRPQLQGQAYAAEVARMAHAALGTQPTAQPATPNGQQQAQQPGARVVKRTAFAPAAQTGGAQPARRAPGQPAPKKDAMQDLNDFLRSGVDMED